MPPQDRPNGYGLIDDTLSNQPPEYPRELPEAGTGWPDGSTPRAKEFNHTLTRHAKWIHRYDQQALMHPLFLGLGTTRLTLNAFEYSTGPGLVATAVEDSAYVVIGYVVDLSLTELNNRGILNHTFTATKDTHHYISTSGVFRFEVVTIGVGPAPNAGPWVRAGCEGPARPCQPCPWRSTAARSRAHRGSRASPGPSPCRTQSPGARETERAAP